MSLEVKEAVFGYRKGKQEKRVLENISYTLEPGELMCILGANGVGKTTMYRSILGFLPLLGGDIFIDGSSIENITSNDLAKKIAYVPQYHEPPFPYTVFQVVLMGRGAHVSTFGSPKKEDENIACEMLERMGIYKLKDDIYTEISGGERQLALIARALAQQSGYILMDEPTSNLDFGNQMRVLKEIRKLADEGYGICFTSHYPDQALMTNAAVMAIEGRSKWQKGPAEQVITRQLLKTMYGLDADIREDIGRDGNIIKRITVEL